MSVDPVPVVSVIVPVRDDATRLRTLLVALAVQEQAPPFEVVVVDNGSTDDSVPVARDAAVQPVVVHEARVGSYAARNAGVLVARGDLLAFTDADCVPAPDWLRAGVVALALAPVVGGDVVARRSPDASVWERYDRAVYLSQAQLVTQQGFAATANLWLRRSVWEQVGGFDETLLSSGDLEWGLRAGRAGCAAVFAPDVVVEHASRSTLAGTWRLHRRLGAGWRVLAARGQWPGVLADPAWRLPLGLVCDLVAADGPHVRRRHLAPVHFVAMTARLSGRLTGR